MLYLCLAAENRARFLDLKNCLLPEIEIVQMWYVTEAFNTVMNVKRELRPKLFKRLRTFTWIDPVHETVRLDPVVFDSEIEILHKPLSVHGSRDFEICERIYARDGALSPKLRKMYAKELLKCGELPDFERSRLCSDTVVPVAGLEPARLAALDFESSTSTNSITPANSAV